MGRIGINTACVQRKSNRSIMEILDFALKNGFSAIEFKDEYPFFEEMSDAEKTNAREIIKKHDLFCSVHLPFADMNISALNPVLREAAVRVLVDSLKNSAEIGATAVTVHGGNINALNYGEEWFEVSEKRTNKSLLELHEVAAKLGIRPAVENLHEFSARLKRVHSRPEDLLRCRNLLGESTGFTFDIGHAFSTPVNPVDFVKQLKPENILISHIHDNDGLEDQHLAVGDGKIDFPAFFQAYTEEGWDFTLMIETRNVDQALLSRERIENLLMAEEQKLPEGGG